MPVEHQAGGRRPGPVQSVRVLLWRADRYLLVQHHHQRQENIGRWGLPGGGIEATDASPEAAVARELREELQIAAGRPTWLFDYPYGSRVHRVFAAECPGGDLVPDPGEIVATRWYTAAQLRAIGRDDQFLTGCELAALAVWTHRLRRGV